MRKGILVALLATVYMLLCACNEADNTNSLAEMQVVYEDNPAHWDKDMKLMWDDTVYYTTNVTNPKPGKQIGYANDEYDDWYIYELKGYEQKYLYAVEKNNEDCWRVMSVYPPDKPWRQYILENATDREKLERMMSVTLYEDGTAELATPPISSYAMIGTYNYVFENNELLIFQDMENITCKFTVSDDNTLIFVSASVPLFATEGARYVRITDKE